MCTKKTGNPVFFAAVSPSSLYQDCEQDGGSDRKHIADTVHHHRIEYTAAFFVTVSVEKAQSSGVKNLHRGIGDLEGGEGKPHVGQSENHGSNDVGRADLAGKDPSFQNQSEHGDGKSPKDQLLRRSCEQELKP